MALYLQPLKKYADFKGRARRKEYWYFTLFILVVAFVLAFLDKSFGTFSESSDIGLLSGIFVAGVIVPAWAVAVRRLHDAGVTGWLVLLSLIPFLSAPASLIFGVLPGQKGANRFGDNPRSELD